VCKTPALGGQVLACKQCGEKKYIYHSCGHSQCPCCQSIKRLQWQDKVSARMLEVPYVHTTFTLPHELNGLARKNPTAIYGLLMRSAWQTIRKLSQDESNLGALPGMIAVLHTFGSDLKYHIHVHTLITFGGLTKSGAWQWPKRKKKLASFREMCSVFRSTFLKGLSELEKKGTVKIGTHFHRIMEDVTQKRWVVNNQYPTANTSLIENYLSRYINRVAVSRNRFKYLADQQKVEILYNDYRAQEANQAAPKATKVLSPLLAIDQILQHVLPPSFQKARYYGLHAPATFRVIKHIIPSSLKRNRNTIRTLFQILHHLLQLKPYQCDVCQSPVYLIYEIPPDRSWIQRFIVLPPNKAPPYGPVI